MGIFRTPLRYPGGKQKLFPFVREILFENDINDHYIEPYAGGAGVAIQLLLSGHINEIHLNDVDRGIYAFWYSILNYTDKFCSKISSVSMSVEEWKRQRDIFRNSEKEDLFTLGFSVFYLNRCNRSGVLNAGIIGGLNQDGNYKMNARFSRNNLIQRIEAIGLYKNKIHISNEDAEYYICNYLPKIPKNNLVYFDPPYFHKAKDLYTNSYKPSDHQKLSELIQSKVKNKWILSYDGVPEILALYKKRKFFLYDLQYSAASSYLGKEIFVFSDKVKIPESSSISSIHSQLNTV